MLSPLCSSLFSGLERTRDEENPPCGRAAGRGLAAPPAPGFRAIAQPAVFGRPTMLGNGVLRPVAQGDDAAGHAEVGGPVRAEGEAGVVVVEREAGSGELA